MDLLYRIMLDKGSSIPLYQQLAEEISAFVECGKLSPGDKLPPIRKFAESLGVNNITVVNAYKQLENNKILSSHIGRGTFVADKSDLKNFNYGILTDYDFDLKNAVNFAKSNIGDEFFPVAAFKNAFNEILELKRGEAFSYRESRGYLPLRAEICKDLQRYGINALEDNMQIISGIQQGIDIVAEALLGPKDTVITERPAYSRRALTIPVDMQKDGMDLDKLEAKLKISASKLIYITSYFQTPTCYSYSLEKKKRLIELAHKYDIYIIEEDSLSDFSYDNKEITPLKALDNNNERVVYIKVYSGKVLPGLNMGALLAPKNIISRILPPNNADMGASAFIQRAFELFLSSGEYYKHIKNMRHLLKGRYNTAINAANANLAPYTAFTPPAGGLNIWFKLCENISVEALANRLLAENIIITPGAIYDIENRDIPYFRLSFAGVEKADIELGIKKIAACIKISTHKEEDSIVKFCQGSNCCT